MMEYRICFHFDVLASILDA